MGQIHHRSLIRELSVLSKNSQIVLDRELFCIPVLIQLHRKILAMQIHITEADGTPFYQQVVNQIKFLVASGRLNEGEQLPPVRRLAEQLLVNPNTIARAYRELESKGVVAAKRGVGVFISDSGSPLSRNEKTRILHERIDALLTESSQLDVGVDSLLKLIEQRSKKFDSTRGGKS